MGHNEITVGPPESNAQIIGTTNESIQLALDALAYRGSGRVYVLPGTYVLQDSIYLRSHVDLCGISGETIFHRSEIISSPLTVDADIGENKVTVSDTSKFQVGMGVYIRGNFNSDDATTTKSRVISIKDNTLYLANQFKRCYGTDEDEGVVTNAFSFVAGYDVENILIKGITVEGLRKKSSYISGCIGGGIYLRNSQKCQIQECVVRNFCGDGISIQTTQDISIQDCLVNNVTGEGFHPGTGSNNTLIQNCAAIECGDTGLYLCWGVQNGKFIDNVFENCRIGISIGHKDTDNFFGKNHVRDSKEIGIIFRRERKTNAASRNLFEMNIVENNGSETPSPGIRISPFTSDITFNQNIIRNDSNRPQGKQKVGVKIEKEVRRIKGKRNIISEHSEGAIDNQSHDDIDLEFEST